MIVLEDTNARYLTRDQVPDAIDFIACDASFIGLEKILPAPMALTRPGAHLVALIKPQFQAGPRDVGKGGVVRDPAVHERVCAEMTDWLRRPARLARARHRRKPDHRSRRQQGIPDRGGARRLSLHADRKDRLAVDAGSLTGPPRIAPTPARPAACILAGHVDQGGVHGQVSGPQRAHRWTAKRRRMGSRRGAGHMACRSAAASGRHLRRGAPGCARATALSAAATRPAQGPLSAAAAGRGGTDPARLGHFPARAVADDRRHAKSSPGKATAI